eukprot:TRINITY_DN67327_c3_g1_i6.p1 TRINITY_DN67327_c3_g1~~TRINITY_DN67327_c3_g1_i6.p1  ORF type:complete len:349 (+),score=35.84 TRINITY_DN67327_c3_g1_i6:43-1089(+)
MTENACVGSLPHSYVTQCQHNHSKPNTGVLKWMQGSEAAGGSVTALSVMDFARNLIGRRAIVPLMETLLKCPNVHSLILTDNYLENDSLHNILKYARQHQSLTHLDFSSNPITHDGGRELEKFVQRKPNITSVGLKGTFINPACVKSIQRLAEANFNKLPPDVQAQHEQWRRDARLISGLDDSKPPSATNQVSNGNNRTPPNQSPQPKRTPPQPKHSPLPDEGSAKLPTGLFDPYPLWNVPPHPPLPPSEKGRTSTEPPSATNSRLSTPCSYGSSISSSSSQTNAKFQALEMVIKVAERETPAPTPEPGPRKGRQPLVNYFDDAYPALVSLRQCYLEEAAREREGQQG